MLFLISSAYADALPQGVTAAPSPFLQFLPMIGVMIVIYFFIIRPQSKKAKEQQAMLESIKKGDAVILNSGIFASVKKIEDKNVVVEISPSVEITVLKSSILNVVDSKITPISKAKAKKTAPSE